jgi:hypothetical protein
LCLADKFFGAAGRVHLGGVDERHAEFETESQRRDLVRSAVCAFRKAPRALAEDRDRLARWKPDFADSIL